MDLWFGQLTSILNVCKVCNEIHSFLRVCTDCDMIYISYLSFQFHRVSLEIPGKSRKPACFRRSHNQESSLASHLAPVGQTYTCLLTDYSLQVILTRIKSYSPKTRMGAYVMMISWSCCESLLIFQIPGSLQGKIQHISQDQDNLFI